MVEKNIKLSTNPLSFLIFFFMNLKVVYLRVDCNTRRLLARVRIARYDSIDFRRW